MANEMILVCGGAGYIGSQVALDLKTRGVPVVVVDNLVRGNRDIVEKLQLPLEVGDILDAEFLRGVFKKYKPAAVMHFAAYSLVGESVVDPSLYYRNNVAGTISLLDVMREFDVNKIIFSSTAATYGVPEDLIITEETHNRPINPYGWSKLMIERVLQDYRTYGMDFVVFRYFNAAGASPTGLIGERHNPESHAIPLALKALLTNGEFKVFGSDYPTKDGTCVRDYVHVADISQAHLLGLDHLLQGKKGGIFNIGSGTGYSVNELLDAIDRVTGKKINRKMSERRPGDPPTLVASSKKLSAELGWKAKYSLDEIIETAWKWHQSDMKK